MSNLVLRDIPPLSSSLSLASVSPPGALCSLDSFDAPPRLQDRLHQDQHQHKQHHRWNQVAHLFCATSDVLGAVASPLI